MVQPRFAGANKQSATAQQAVKAYAACAANWTSKSQLVSPVECARFGATKIEVAIAVTVKALTVFKDALAESKGQFPSMRREP
jgi:hypothetical protein